MPKQFKPLLPPVLSTSLQRLQRRALDLERAKLTVVNQTTTIVQPVRRKPIKPSYLPTSAAASSEAIEPIGFLAYFTNTAQDIRKMLKFQDNTWSAITTPASLISTRDFVILNQIHYITDYNNNLYKSSNKGSTWSQSAFSAAGALDINANNTALYITAGTQLYKSVDNGSTWSLLTTNPTSDIRGLACHLENSSIVAIRNYHIAASKSHPSVQVSFNSGGSWTTVVLEDLTGTNKFIDETGTEIHTVLFTSDNRLIAIFRIYDDDTGQWTYKLYVSAPNNYTSGYTTVNLFSGGGPFSTESMSFCETNDYPLFLTVTKHEDPRVYMSNDGLTWVRLPNPFADGNDVISLFYQPSINKLWTVVQALFGLVGTPYIKYMQNPAVDGVWIDETSNLQSTGLVSGIQGGGDLVGRSMVSL